MNRDDIIQMAIEVGGVDKPEPDSPALAFLERFAELVAAAERKALLNDAERYRWLREESRKNPDFYSSDARWMVSRSQGGMGQNFFGDKIDAAIDAARRGENERI